MNVPWQTQEGEEYGARIDAIVRSEQVADFTREDWLRLAFAAIDQASTRETLHDDKQALAKVEVLLSDEEAA